VIEAAARFERVLLDTSVLVSFGQAGQLFQLVQYLGERGSVVLDVEVEVRRLAAGRFPDLKTLALLRWPPGGSIALPTHLLADARDLQRTRSRPGAEPAENRGEIATVLLAQHQGALAILDDRLGRDLARFRGLPYLTTPQLAAEMVVAGATDEELALRVFAAATSQPVGPQDVAEAVARARTALGR